MPRHQPRNHFAEWFTAIHIFQRDGWLSLVEKYAFPSHAAKRQKMEVILGDRFERFDKLVRNVGGQPPDLLLYTSRGDLAGFAEVKGPGDRVQPRQLRMLREIRGLLGVPVELVSVRLVP